MRIKDHPYSTFLLQLSFVILSVSICLIGGSVGDEIASSDNATFEKFDCTHLMLRAAKESVKSLYTCSKELKANTTSNKELADKIGCVMKCAMHRVHLTNAEHKVTDETLMTMMKKYVPTEPMMVEVHEKIVAPCEEAASKLDPTEVSCMTYANYALCMQSGIEDYINTSKFCLPKKKRQ